MISRCGFVSIIGRPNVGKSTLMNRILGQKVSITSNRPQTTRHRILGIKTTDTAQAIYVDTPGVHLGAKRAMNRYMNKAAQQTLSEVDVVLFVVEGTKWTDEDQAVFEQLKKLAIPVIFVVNKVDQIAHKDVLLPFLQQKSSEMQFADVVPVSAKQGDQVDVLEQTVEKYLPESEPFFPEEQITDRSERFLAAELIREKLMRTLGQELPYYLTVEIEKFREERKKGVLHIAALIWVERDGQKAIIIGKGGEKLKEIGSIARADMEKLFGMKVFLQLWVRVKSGWSDDVRALRSLGYTDDE